MEQGAFIYFGDGEEITSSRIYTAFEGGKD